MIIFCAADKIYFDLYFKLWAKQVNKHYPNYDKIIALYGGTPEDIYYAESLGVKVINVTNDPRMPLNPKTKHFYHLRWANLPFENGLDILSTQVNCLAVQGSHDFDHDVDHVRIVRKKGGNRIGGISAAIFTPEAAQKVVEQSTKMLKEGPAETDHEINGWKVNNLNWENLLLEEQIRQAGKPLDSHTRFITAGTSAHFSPKDKLNVLYHYLKND